MNFSRKIPTIFNHNNAVTQYQSAPYAMIHDPDHPHFFRQFSSNYRSEADRKRAVDALENGKLSYHQIATLELEPETRSELAQLSVNMAFEILLRRTPYRELVFVHLIKSINKIQHEIINLLENEADESTIIRRNMFLLSLVEQLKFCNDRKCFIDIDLSHLDLSNLDFTHLNLNLSHANVTGTILTGINWDTTILPHTLRGG